VAVSERPVASRPSSTTAATESRTQVRCMATPSSGQAAATEAAE
jgi:hypothetical protein